MRVRIQVNCIKRNKFERYSGRNDRIYQPPIRQEEKLENENDGEDNGVQLPK